ncbi:galactokinase [Mycobacterium tuberculosis]|nr:galactokinase [Mycobacterium tuberculosis]COV78899.1 galactokinase [Mycobacterium tuberculosis]
MTVSYGAPGRVNLIGEHTDYNLGFALPIALPRRTVVTFTPEHTGAITARSDRADGSARIPLDTTPGQVTGWAAYAAGAIWALRGAGHPVPGGAMSITSDVEIGSGLSSSAALIGAVLGAVGAATGTRIDRLERARLPGWPAYAAGAIWALRGAGHPVPGGAMSITSDVEIGSGLSSSAALIGAVLGAVGAATGTRIDRLERARLAQRAENDYVGAPTGLLDHLAALFGAPKTALLIDFRDITVRPVAFDPDACDVVLLLMDSRARHCHAGGEYALRRASCERAAADLGVSSLRAVQDRGLAALGAIADPIDARRARHVLTENQRVLDFAAALADSDFTAAGQLLTASHESMREDFAITTERIDLIAESAVRAGALGARMTGGGFGGAVIALVPADRARDVADTVRRAAVTAGYDEPAVSRTYAAPGAAECR